MKVRADEIKHALQKKHHEDFFLTEVKNGPTQTVKHHLKLDALAIKRSWANPAIIGYEVKVSRSDFQRDEKWPAYLAYCNQFCFVCPKGLIQPEELPPEVGLIYFNPETGALSTKRKAMHRLIDEPIDMYKYIIMSRLDSDRYPFFSSAREFVEAFLQDKDERKQMGRHFSIAVTGTIRKLEDEILTLKRKSERDADDVEQYQKLRQLLYKHGIRIDRWSQWEQELEAALSTAVSPNVARTVRRLADTAAELQRMFESQN